MYFEYALPAVLDFYRCGYKKFFYVSLWLMKVSASKPFLKKLL